MSKTLESDGVGSVHVGAKPSDTDSGGDELPLVNYRDPYQATTP